MAIAFFDFLSLKTSPKAIITLCIGNEFEKISQLTHPLMDKYAKNIGADFRIIRERKSCWLPVHYEKYQLSKYLDVYERVLFVDTDVVIRPDSPDLFDCVPENTVGAYLASEDSNCHDTSIKEIQNELGDLGWRTNYFNSGVMVVSRSHRGLFDLSHGSFNGFYEQTQLNYNLQKLKLPIFNLTFRYNHVQFKGEPISKGTSYFIHYAGPGHGVGPKHEQIALEFKELLEIETKE